jgi:hypothetical protein
MIHDSCAAFFVTELGVLLDVPAAGVASVIELSDAQMAWL